jgi:hypothetical protein
MLVVSRSGADHYPIGAGVDIGMGCVLLSGVVICFALLVKAAFMVPAGVGVLLRKQWGRILTLVLAALALQFYLFALISVAQEPVGDAHGSLKTIVIVIAAAQVLYATLAFIILVKNGAEFSSRQVHSEVPARPSRSVAVTAIGLFTLLLGGAYAALSIWLFSALGKVFTGK